MGKHWRYKDPYYDPREEILMIDAGDPEETYQVLRQAVAGAYYPKDREVLKFLMDQIKEKK